MMMICQGRLPGAAPRNGVVRAGATVRFRDLTKQFGHVLAVYRRA